MVDTLEVPAPAKINLTLFITGRRPDGYHLLSSLMQKVDLCDRVILRRQPGTTTLACSGADLPEDENNIALRAALAFRDGLPAAARDGFGVHIRLEKRIPVAAGLGGGSSDAAAVLSGLSRMFPSWYSTGQLARIGLSLGADVPFFLADHGCCLATGIGEQLMPAAGLDDQLVLLVNPGFPVSTRWVYENFSLTSGAKKRNLPNSHSSCASDGPESLPLRIHDLHNDLEQVTAGKFREIDTIKGELLDRGAMAALMSGSGPTVFGIFSGDQRSAAEDCRRELAGRYPHVFLVSPWPVAGEQV